MRFHPVSHLSAVLKKYLSHVHTYLIYINVTVLIWIIAAHHLPSSEDNFLLGFLWAFIRTRPSGARNEGQVRARVAGCRRNKSWPVKCVV